MSSFWLTTEWSNLTGHWQGRRALSWLLSSSGWPGCIVQAFTSFPLWLWLVAICSHVALPRPAWPHVPASVGSAGHGRLRAELGPRPCPAATLCLRGLGSLTLWTCSICARGEPLCVCVLGAEGTAPAGRTKCPRGDGAALLAAGGRSEAGWESFQLAVLPWIAEFGNLTSSVKVLQYVVASVASLFESKRVLQKGHLILLPDWNHYVDFHTASLLHVACLHLHFCWLESDTSGLKKRGCSSPWEHFSLIQNSSPEGTKNPVRERNDVATEWYNG